MTAASVSSQRFDDVLERDGLATLDLGGDAQALCDRAVWEIAPLLSASKTGRVQDAWRVSPAVRQLATLPTILDALRDHFGREPFAFQTLNFERGSQQPPHTDALHFHSDPPGLMCGVWIALEDISNESGPLLYYPGSHKLPYPEDALRLNAYSEQGFTDRLLGQLSEQGSEATTVAPRKGEAVVWAANLVHGGSSILDSSATRRSLVIHYFFRGTTFYTPLNSRLTAGRMRLRLPTDIATGGLVWPRDRNGKRRAIRPQAVIGWMWKAMRRKPVVY